MLLNAGQSCLVIVDVQENLLPAVIEPERLLANCAFLMRVAAKLDVPVLTSEQYPRGLGPTVGELRGLADNGQAIEKVEFSCMANPAFSEKFEAIGRPQAVIAGIEAHVCVLQTALQLRQRGHQTFVAGDATASRGATDARLAIQRMREAGAQIVSTEMIAFEWLGRAGTSVFKEVSALIKARDLTYPKDR
jgi:hypothetical protein